MKILMVCLMVMIVLALSIPMKGAENLSTASVSARVQVPVFQGLTQQESDLAAEQFVDSYYDGAYALIHQLEATLSSNDTKT
jgi:hypothetical protein